MPNRKAPSCISPVGVRHFYRSADLHGLRLALWEDVDDSAESVADYLRHAGASVEVLANDAPSLNSPVLPPMMARYKLSSLWAEDEQSDIRFTGISVMGAPDRPDLMQIDAAVLNLREPTALAQSLQAAGIPFVMFTEELELCLGLYPHGICVPSRDGPETLASAILLHSALYHAGLCCTPDMTVAEMMPRLRAMARFLVQDAALSDDLVADAMEQALAFLPHLRADQEIGALLVLLIERIWLQQKMSRPI